jgi:hypothetical protein
VLHTNVHHGNLNDALLETRDPITAPEGRESLGDGFVQAFRRDFDGVRYALQVLDGDAAGRGGPSIKPAVQAGM